MGAFDLGAGPQELLEPNPVRLPKSNPARGSLLPIFPSRLGVLELRGMPTGAAIAAAAAAAAAAGAGRGGFCFRIESQLGPIRGAASLVDRLPKLPKLADVEIVAKGSRVKKGFAAWDVDPLMGRLKRSSSSWFSFLAGADRLSRSPSTAGAAGAAAALQLSLAVLSPPRFNRSMLGTCKNNVRSC